MSGWRERVPRLDGAAGPSDRRPTAISRCWSPAPTSISATPAPGLGVFTARPVAAGAVIVADEDGTLRRRALPLAAALAQGWDRAHDLFQIDHDLFLPPRGCFDDLFNHSCEPSGGWRLTGRARDFVAIRDLAAGERAHLRLFLPSARPGRADGLRLRERRAAAA